MYGKEASNRKQEIDCQHHTIPNQRNQRPKDKHRGNVYNLLFRHGKVRSQNMEKLKCSFPTFCKRTFPQLHKIASYAHYAQCRLLRNPPYLEYLTDDLFHYSAGQQCTIYKAAAFTTGDEIIYIPDISLNDIPMDRPLRNGEEIEEVLSVCYAGVDFVQECAGDVKLAERLFYYCDWQHPSSALPEVDCEDEVI